MNTRFLKYSLKSKLKNKGATIISKNDLQLKGKLGNKDKTNLQTAFNVINILPEDNEKNKKEIEKELFVIFRKYS